MTVSTNEYLLPELCYRCKRILGWDMTKYPWISFSFSAALVTQLQLWRLPWLVSVQYLKQQEERQQGFVVETLAKLSPCMTVSTNECLLREPCYRCQRILGCYRPKYLRISFSFSATVVTQLQLWRLPWLVSVESVGQLYCQETYVLQVPLSGRICCVRQISGRRQ